MSLTTTKGIGPVPTLSTAILIDPRPGRSGESRTEVNCAQENFKESGIVGWLVWPMRLRVVSSQPLHAIAGFFGPASGGKGTRPALAAAVGAGPSFPITGGRVDGPAVHAPKRIPVIVSTAAVVTPVLPAIRRDRRDNRRILISDGGSS